MQKTNLRQKITRKLEKRPLRILIATHAPLSPEYGAAQMAINLGQAFKDLGHRVTLWSPQPIPTTVPSWNRFRYMQKGLLAFLEAQPDFDVIDCPPFMLTEPTKNKALIVCRDVQPDLLYLLSGLNIDLEQGWKDLLRFPFNCLNASLRAVDVIRGWSVANQIYCLGTHELRWMEKWFPFWQEKLTVYDNAISETDQRKLEHIRKERPQLRDESIKFLWIGRWVRHKGITELAHFIEDWLLMRPQDSFTIAGCGDCKFSKMLSKLSESGQVNVIPQFSRVELFDLLANHHVGLFSSRVEGWGLSINEMLESGMPVFATAAGGVEDLKALLGSRLKPFPPTIEALPNHSTLDPWPAEYYQRFTWEAIAKKYLNKLMT
jgi:glycosyltransferase involved in cell wall biosynthesis